MPRFPRFCPAGIPVHIIQRGNNKQACFTCDGDITTYIHWLAEGATKYDLKIHAWVFMTNHVHLLLTPTYEGSVSSLMQYVGRLYVRRFNYQYARTGTLFEGRFRSSLVQDSQYLLKCLQYIELNPVRSGIVQDPGSYKWSSYRSHAFGDLATMWSPHPLYTCLGESTKERQAAYREQISKSLTVDAIAKIRRCINSGLVLGTEQFREQIKTMRT